MAEVEPFTLQVWYEALALALLYAYAAIGFGYFLAKIIKRSKTVARRAPRNPRDTLKVKEERMKKEEKEN